MGTKHAFRKTLNIAKTKRLQHRSSRQVVVLGVVVVVVVAVVVVHVLHRPSTYFEVLALRNVVQGVQTRQQAIHVVA